MSLTLYTDAYATVANVDTILYGNRKWSALDTTGKEAHIKRATLQIDAGFTPGGALVASDQALQFPRDFGDQGLALAEQTRQLAHAVAAQVEYNLYRLPIGVGDYQLGGEIITGRQELLCREAFNSLNRFQRVGW